jgi:hypothetical protein
LVALTVVAASVVTFLGQADSARTWLQTVFRHGVIVTPLETFGGFHSWFLIAVTAVFVVSLVSIGLLVQARNEIDGDLAKTRKSLENAMRSAREIRERHFPAPAVPACAYESIRRCYYIAKNYDTQVCSEFAFSAVGAELRTLELNFGAEDDADPVLFLEDMEFSVKDSRQDEALAYLQILNEARFKRIVLFPLPALAVGERREYSYSFAWPGMFKRLKKRSEEYTAEIKSAKAIGVLEIGVFVDPQIDKSSVHLEKIGRQPPDAVVTDATGFHATHQGWKGKLYRATGVTLDTVSLRINLK